MQQETSKAKKRKREGGSNMVFGAIIREISRERGKDWGDAMRKKEMREMQAIDRGRGKLFFPSSSQSLVRCSSKRKKRQTSSHACHTRKRLDRFPDQSWRTLHFSLRIRWPISTKIHAQGRWACAHPNFKDFLSHQFFKI